MGFRVTCSCGFAAAQCGEALPHGHTNMKKKEAAPPCVEAQPRRWKSTWPLPVSRRLTALRGGKAASVLLAVLLLTALCSLPTHLVPFFTVGLLPRAFSQNQPPAPQPQPSPTPSPTPTPSP